MIYVLLLHELWQSPINIQKSWGNANVTELQISKFISQELQGSLWDRYNIVISTFVWLNFAMLELWSLHSDICDPLAQNRS